jgi:hypothetical protein
MLERTRRLLNGATSGDRSRIPLNYFKARVARIFVFRRRFMIVEAGSSHSRARRYPNHTRVPARHSPQLSTPALLQVEHRVA